MEPIIVGATILKLLIMTMIVEDCNAKLRAIVIGEHPSRKVDMYTMHHKHVRVRYDAQCFL